MSILFGTSNASEIFLGTSSVSRVYLGTALVWERGAAAEAGVMALRGEGADAEHGEAEEQTE